MSAEDGILQMDPSSPSKVTLLGAAIFVEIVFAVFRSQMGTRVCLYLPSRLAWASAWEQGC